MKKSTKLTIGILSTLLIGGIGVSIGFMLLNKNDESQTITIDSSSLYIGAPSLAEASDKLNHPITINYSINNKTYSCDLSSYDSNNKDSNLVKLEGCFKESDINKGMNNYVFIDLNHNKEIEKLTNGLGYKDWHLLDPINNTVKFTVNIKDLDVYSTLYDKVEDSGIYLSDYPLHDGDDLRVQHSQIKIKETIKIV